MSSRVGGANLPANLRQAPPFWRANPGQQQPEFSVALRALSEFYPAGLYFPC
jgi:hypothetical protein